MQNVGRIANISLGYVNILNYDGAGAHHTVTTDGYIVTYATPDSQPSAFTDIYVARNMCPHGHVDVVGNSTVMVHRSSSVHNSPFADNGIGINYSASHHDGTLTDFHTPANCAIRMNKANQFAIDVSLNSFSRRGITYSNNVVEARPELTCHRGGSDNRKSGAL